MSPRYPEENHRHPVAVTMAAVTFVAACAFSGIELVDGGKEVRGVVQAFDTAASAPAQTASPKQSASKSPTTAPTPEKSALSSPATSQPPRSTIRLIDATAFNRMKGKSWRKECPGPDQLRFVDVPYHNFQQQTKIGTLVVNKAIADTVASDFEKIYAIGYPINQIKPLEDILPADTNVTDNKNAKWTDDLSMAKNNTSAFNCRFVAGSKNLSNHAYGYAIDINPLENPEVYANGSVEPAAGAKYLSPTATDPAIISKSRPLGNQVINILLANEGWRWGGTFTEKDPQHFDVPSPPK